LGRDKTFGFTQGFPTWGLGVNWDAQCRKRAADYLAKTRTFNYGRNCGHRIITSTHGITGNGNLNVGTPFFWTNFSPRHKILPKFLKPTGVKTPGGIEIPRLAQPFFTGFPTLAPTFCGPLINPMGIRNGDITGLLRVVPQRIQTLTGYLRNPLPLGSTRVALLWAVSTPLGSPPHKGGHFGGKNIYSFDKPRGVHKKKLYHDFGAPRKFIIGQTILVQQHVQLHQKRWCSPPTQKGTTLGVCK